MIALLGSALGTDIAIGYAHIIDPKLLHVEYYHILYEEIDTEIKKFEEAILKVKDELQKLKDSVQKNAPEEISAFLEVHLLILQDHTLCQTPKELIRHKLYNAAWALVHQLEILMNQFDQMQDEYLRERKYDVQQVVEKVLNVLLLGDERMHSVHDQSIIISHDMPPSDLLKYKAQNFAGFITSSGGRNSHTAILAKSLNTPAMVGCHKCTDIIQQGDLIIIDGQQNTVLINPSQTILEDYQWRKTQQSHEKKRLERVRHIPTQTIDGIAVELMANIELPEDCETLAQSGVNGVGLFRSEFVFLQNDELPDEETQYQAYLKAVKYMNGLPITIRTIDIGADKQLKSVDSSASPLGLRAIRWSLSEPDIFQTQLRAILRASHHGLVQILIPMICHVSEMKACRFQLQKAMYDLEQEGIPFDQNIKLGAMIEIPATAFALPMFFADVDFLSIGTNDLMQYLLAIDREETQLAHLYNPEHPAILHLLAHVIQMANLAHKPIAICGELAGDTRFTKLLLGFGLRSFSMHVNRFLDVKSNILSTQLAEIKPWVQKVLNSYNPDEISKLIEEINQV